jgi:probable HAF family extracellular repeat protein
MATKLWAALAVALISAGSLSATTMYNFQTFDVPGGSGDESWGINGAGQVVGYYSTANGNLGFLYNPTTQTYTTLTGPAGASDIRAFGINDNGAIVGDYRDSSNNTHGFLYANGTYQTIDGPGAQFGTTVTGINDSGQLSLTYFTSSANSAYRWTPFGSGYNSQRLSIGGNSTDSGGINNSGEIGGYFQTPNYGAFLWNSNGTSSTFEEPNDTSGTTQALDLNDYGEVVGSFFSPTGESGFVDQGGVFTQINVPNSIYTYTTGVNDSGEIAGWYLDSNDRMHSFTATPNSAAPEAASFALLTLGCSVLAFVGRRRALSPATPRRVPFFAPLQTLFSTSTSTCNSTPPRSR